MGPALENAAPPGPVGQGRPPDLHRTSCKSNVIAKPVRTLAVAIRPQSLPCLKGGDQPQAGGGIRAGKNLPVTASPCLGKGAINLSDASHISPYTGGLFPCSAYPRQFAKG